MNRQSLRQEPTGPRSGGRHPAEAGSKARKLLSIIVVSVLIAGGFSIVQVPRGVQALDFIESVSVPWSSTFTPLDSAWDSSGTQCVVVGNETDGVSPSAWLYHEPTKAWSPIYEGTDPTAKVSKRVFNDVTGIVYPSVQLAVNDASAGDVIRLWSGTYCERVIVDRAITLLGNGSANTIIDGENTGIPITITADGVKVFNLGITGGLAYPGILAYEANYSRIENNTIEGNGDGIRLFGSSHNTIKNNDITGNSGAGVRTMNGTVQKTLAGFTEGGGDNDYGTLFTSGLSGDNYSMTHSFNFDYTDGCYADYGKPIQDLFDSNILYGVTQEGGDNNEGTIYKTNKAASSYVLLHSFSWNLGSRPRGGLVQYGNALFGTTNSGGTGYGLIFKINTDGTDYQVIHYFAGSDGSSPTAELTLVGTTLFGMTPSGGTNGVGVIFRLNMDGSGFTVLTNFANRAPPTWGAYPYGGLIPDSNTGTILFGMTTQGGSAANAGCIFRVNLDGSGYKVLQNFSNAAMPNYGAYPQGSLLQVGTILYGTTYSGGGSGAGVIFRVNVDGTSYKCMYNFSTSGISPRSTLVRDASNVLYGMTYSSASGMGTVFAFNLGTSVCTFPHLFSGTPDGRRPRGSLMYDGTYLYGTTESGGANDLGTLFRMNTGGTVYSILHSFAAISTNGRNPYGRPAQSGSCLYGAAYAGGEYDDGCVFRTDLDGNGFTIIRSFSYAAGDGSSPQASPLVVGSYLIGTTLHGGPSNAGVLYRMNLDGSGYTTLHQFVSSGGDGYYPYGTPILVGGVLYGTTYSGGSSSRGTIYKIGIDGSGYQILYSFAGSPSGPAYPYFGLVSDGTNLYGTTSSGGASNNGCVFSARCDGTSLSMLYSFLGSSSDGMNPYCTPVLDGTSLYGTVYSGGAYSTGAVFKVDVTGSGFELLTNFSASSGTYPCGGLTMDGSMLYGTTNNGGSFGYGTLFRIDKVSKVLSVLHTFRGTPALDGAYAYYDELTIVLYPAPTSASNIIYHNNFIDNAIQAVNDDPPGNSWYSGLSGNYWSDYSDPDADNNGIGDVARVIPDVAGTVDMYPHVVRDGWVMPYMTFRSVAWDQARSRFWLCGEYSADSQSTFYYILGQAPTTMVPINAPPITFTALAVDNLGNLLVGGNNLQYIFYYDVSLETGYGIAESATGAMYGWNITGITFNPADSRFYVVGNVLNQDQGAAFFTDPLPLTGTSYCYEDTSAFMQSPGIGALKSIQWNPSKSYALAVGDGVYQLEAYDGNPGKALTWSTIKAAKAGRSYSDVSWDTDAWDEAGIVGADGAYACYWRYYDTSPTLKLGQQSGTSGTEYTTCAMKPPSSPKWLLIPAGTGTVRVNVQEKYEGGEVAVTLSNKPTIEDFQIFLTNDTARTDLFNIQVDAGTAYTFLIEGEYTLGWDNAEINIVAWHDSGEFGSASEPGGWNSWNRTRQFNITYTPATNSTTVHYPATENGVSEFTVLAAWNESGYGPTGDWYRTYITVRFGTQMLAATGLLSPAAGYNDANLALNDVNTWDVRATLYDRSDPSTSNVSYDEFGVKEYAWISNTGTPRGAAPPGATNVHLSCSFINYSINTNHSVTVSIPNLYKDGNPLMSSISASSMTVQNLNATSQYSDVATQASFLGPNAPLYVWGKSAGPVLIAAPYNGTRSAGPSTDHSAGFEVFTVLDWWLTGVPASTPEGTYYGTITVTLGY